MKFVRLEDVQSACPLRYMTGGIPICSAGGCLCDRDCYESWKADKAIRNATT